MRSNNDKVISETLESASAITRIAAQLLCVNIFPSAFSSLFCYSGWSQIVQIFFLVMRDINYRLRCS